jgi:hypothetical protein
MQYYEEVDTMFENRLINGYTYASRFIASWVRVGGRLHTGKDIDMFRDWLNSIEGLSDEDVNNIVFLATNGKLELETHAKKFIVDMD